MPVIPALGRLRQKGIKFKSSLNFKWGRKLSKLRETQEGQTAGSGDQAVMARDKRHRISKMVTEALV
jgi:hypothetical protein